MFLTIVIKITLNSFGQFHQNHTERPNKHIEKKWSCLNGWGEFSRGNQMKCAELMKRANASARSFMWILDRHAHNKPLNNNDEWQRLWRPISEHDMTQQIGSKFFRICCFFLHKWILLDSMLTRLWSSWTFDDSYLQHQFWF